MVDFSVRPFSNKPVMLMKGEKEKKNNNENESLKERQKVKRKKEDVRGKKLKREHLKETKNKNMIKKHKLNVLCGKKVSSQFKKNLLPIMFLKLV